VDGAVRLTMAGASPLVQRVATAALLVPLVVGGILLLPSRHFAVLLVVLVVLAGWEWAGLMGLTNTSRRLAYGALVGAAAAGAVPLTGGGAGLVVLLGAALAAWLGALLAVARFPHLPEWSGRLSVAGLAGLLVLVPPFAALVALHRSGEQGLVLFLMVLIWVADSAAFFSGRRFGRRRLAPRVSPGKTWEGLAGALAGTLAVAALGAWWLGLEPAGMGWFAALCLVTVLFSVLGDLLESVAKRTRGVKDSGALLPGHGGVLDRIDSLTAAAPVFVLGLLLWGRLGA
jgi:phosphatidate cytidylyltransferase